ncbi:glucose 1-dehydrogenase [Gordonia pseudamarae]|uniref:Glucose 1-dehydrogenase n=1 Tax=Gordonia pseudamarae TaxID=2831662 RepID=A0ABX6II26_9ACTN|nr:MULTISPECIES: 3-oxoacyl-ACP reductase family protein [Gordonia]MBD0021382.1 3-oxoacyl-ACP reductase FabG [Gordonia sp. (in: high G+C Gram-positive bacteria)]QHN26447.1 glucose 1-dehydrogenase [Gordonia pseudamarae]QHN35342.1 glucose 1-dehydrogenase [Gordonia pseudamarae]
MTTRLNGKIAFVTGAGQGIGAAIAHRLAADGATVIVTDLNAETATATAAELGNSSVGLQVDVTDRDSVNAAVDEAVATFGRIDILVNNAGWDKGEPFVDSEPETWDRIVAINLYGVLNTCKKIVPLMQQQGSGKVVNLGSDAGRVGSSGEAVYAAAKGGVISFTKSLARETARNQINVNCVCPGPTDTALFASMGGEKLREALKKAIPMRRLGRPEDLAKTVAFLSSDDADFITGQTVSVSGGLTMS